MATPLEIRQMRKTFLKLDQQLKEFGKKRCKIHACRKNPKHHSVDGACSHLSMAFGGMGRNSDCELVNCPRILHEAEPKKEEYKRWRMKPPENGGI